MFSLPSAAVFYFIFQESKSDNSQDTIIMVERVAGYTQLEDASSSAGWYDTWENSLKSGNDLTIWTNHHTARSKDANVPEECKPLLNGNNGTEGSESVSDHHENGNGKDEMADHISSTKPVTWKIEDLEAPKS